MLSFSAEHGYVDAIVRGYFSHLISNVQYAQFIQSDSLDELGNLLEQILPEETFPNSMIQDRGNQEDQPERSQQIVPQMTPNSLIQSLQAGFTTQFKYVRFSARGQMATLLDFVTLSYQLDNVLLLLTGLEHGYDLIELKAMLNPLGYFEGLLALTAMQDVHELYEGVLATCPRKLSNYLQGAGGGQDGIAKQNLQITRGLLHGALLKDMFTWVEQELGGDQVESSLISLLQLEADRRNMSVIMVTMAIEDRDLAYQQRASLLLDFGKVPKGPLLKVADTSSLRELIQFTCPEYEPMLAALDEKATALDMDSGNQSHDFEHVTSSKTLDEHFQDREVELCKEAFMNYFTLGPIYGWVKLKEQEMRNVKWIADCILQKHRAKAGKWLKEEQF